MTSKLASARSRAEIWRSFAPVGRREVSTVVLSTFQSQSTSAFFFLLLSLLALDISGSLASAPLVVVAGALPLVLFVRAVRTVNRLLDERWVMLFSDLGALSVSLTLWALVHSGNAQLWHVYLGMFLFSTFGAFYLPAMRAWASGRTGSLEQLTWLNAMLAVATQASVVLGWALGGVVASLVGIASSLAICAVSYGLGIVLQFVVFVVVNRAPFRRPSLGVEHGADASEFVMTGVWREICDPRRLGLYTASLLLLEVTQKLAFSMFVPLLTAGDTEKSWIAGIANASFALTAIMSGVAISGGIFGHYARTLAPHIVITGFCIQIVFGLSATLPVLAICLYALVGLLSGGDSALQSEVQDRWHKVGAAQAYAVFGAIQGPSQIFGALVISSLITWFSVPTVYIATIATLGIGAGISLLLARLRAPKMTIG